MTKTIDKVIKIYQDIVLYFGKLCEKCWCCSPKSNKIIGGNYF